MSTSDLRRRAEERMRRVGGDATRMPTADAQALVHELEVRQVELEMQNEELRQAHGELAQSRDLLETRVTERTSQVRVMANRLRGAQEDERRRIAEGLHDEVGQMLAAAQIKLALAERCADARCRKELLCEADRLLNQTVDQIRCLTFELDVDQLFHAGFVPAVRELADHMEARFGIRFDVVNPAAQDITLPEALYPVLFRCLRELLYNVVRHAGVRQATVRLETGQVMKEDERDARRVRVIVHDDGKGFDASRLDTPLTRQGGFGLYHVREQLRDIQGALTVESVPGNGTRAIMEVTLEP